MSNRIPVLVVIAVAVWSVWPMVKCPGCVADIGRDGLLLNWIITTAGGNLYGLHSGSGGSLFAGSIFYPYKNVLAYSDMHYLTALWTYPVAKLFGDIRAVSGLAQVSGQVLTVVIIYLWWKKIFRNGWGAAVAALAFGLSQIRFAYQVHLQMWSMQYWLVAVWLMVSWMEDNKAWKLFLGAGILGLQVWESLLPLYFAALMAGSRYLILKPKLQWKKLLTAGLILAAAAGFPLAAYWGVNREFDYQRSIRDAANFSLGVDDIWGMFASPGLYVLLTVAMLGIFRQSTSPPKSPSPMVGEGLEVRYRREAKWLVIVGVSSLVMALGPVLKWGGKTVKVGGRLPIPLPYAAAYYAVPGFGALRTPSRWIWVSGWAASGLIALGIGNLQFPIFNWKKTAALIGLFGIAVVGGTRIMKVREVPGVSQTPAVYEWLFTRPGRVIAILPMYQSEEEIDRLPFSYVHRKLTLNGFSGFYPPQRLQEAVRWTAGFPRPEVVAEMKAYGTEYVVVEKTKAPDFAKAAPGGQNLKLEYEDKDYRVYRL
jgi:hypothetical protein